MTKIQIIEDYVKTLPEAQFGHGYDHFDRVRNWGLKIAKIENYSKTELIEAAALLHDIGIGKAVAAKSRKFHGQFGAEMAKEFLMKKNLFNKEEIQEIYDAIICHNTVNETKNKLTEILRDADILDLLGALGILRGAISEAQKKIYDPENIKGETWRMGVKEFNERFASAKGIGETLPDQFNFQISCFENLRTDFAKKIAAPLVKTMRDFLLELEREINQNSE